MRRLLSYEYLLEPIPGQPGPFRLFYLLLAFGTCCGLLLLTALWRKHRYPRLWRALEAEAVLTLCALLLVACALAGVPFLSMRILVFGANLLAWFLPVIVWAWQREQANVRERVRRALGGQMDVVQPLLPRYTSLLLVGAHLVGLMMLTAHYGWPMWFPILLLLGLLSPQLWFSLRTRRWRVHLEALAPLFWVYGVLVARVLVLVVAKLLAYPHFFLPAAWDNLLNVTVALFVAVPWAFFSQVYSILRYQRHEQAMLPGIAAVCLLLSFTWAAYAYIHLRTRGVTGTDPYCYAQMAVDLAEQGAPVHSFPLVAHMEQLGVFPEAGVHLGYHLPFDARGRAATVWPIGQSVLLAIGYGLAGEGGLYLATPVLGLLSLVAMAALSWELLAGRSTGEKLWVGAVSVLLLATSYAQIERLVVPMADAAAQLFTTLTALLWVQAMRSPAVCGVPPSPRRGRAGRVTRGSRKQAWAFLAGLSFGCAYLVRHTQLVLAASILFLAWVTRAEKRQKAAALAWFAVAACLVAIPDLLYHQWVMGHWLRPESLELRHFSFAFVGPMAVRAVRDLFGSREFLCVSPFILYGLWRQWREDRAHFGMLSSWLIAVLLIHLPYEALRLRDLLSVFPVLCFWAGYGVLGLWRWLTDLPRLGMPVFLRGLGYGFLLMALFLLRTGPALELARATDFDAFGHLNVSQRAGFARIGQDTEETALIGASLNSGTIEMHSRRTAFRPTVWRTDELYTFVDDAMTRGTPVYLLEDGLEMAAPVAAARERYELELLGRYDVPFYHTGGGSTGGRVSLFRIQPKIGYSTRDTTYVTQTDAQDHPRRHTSHPQDRDRLRPERASAHRRAA